MRVFTLGHFLIPLSYIFCYPETHPQELPQKVNSSKMESAVKNITINTQYHECGLSLAIGEQF